MAKKPEKKPKKILTLKELEKTDPKMYDYFLYSKNKHGSTWESFKKEFRL